MPPGFVKGGGVFPEPDTMFLLEVLGDDGVNGRLFKSDALGYYGEVDLIRRDVDANESLVIPVAFKSLDQAERAGDILAAAFEQVRAILAEDTPQPDDGHEHDPTGPIFFGRTTTKHVICKLCGKELREVPVKEWQREAVV